MSYAAQQDMITRFGQKEMIELTDHANNGVIDSTVMQRALDDSSAEIDGYLATVYAVPLSPVPAMVQRLCCDMTRYYLCGDRANQAIQDRYKYAIAFLRDVASNKASLGIDSVTGNPAGESSDGGPRAVAAGRIFTRDSLSDF